MRPKDESTSPSGRTPARPTTRRTPPNAFSPEYLADARERDEALTASEAEFSGPWKLEPLPDRPGSVAVVRESENLVEGDVPEAVFRDEEAGRAVRGRVCRCSSASRCSTWARPRIRTATCRAATR